MIHKEMHAIEWLEFEKLNLFNRLRHGVFLRNGGISSAPFSSFNLGDRVGDLAENIEQHVHDVTTILNIPLLTWVKQSHGNQIVCVENAKHARALKVLEADAMITSCVSIGLVIHHADCQAAIIYDPIQHIIANVHCGWRGNVQNIYADVIRKMQQEYACLPRNLIVGISPSLGPAHAEFVNYRTELPRDFWIYQVGSCHFDLWEISKAQLITSGILPQNIEIAKRCTYANPQHYFSYRRDKITGRHGTVVGLIAANDRLI